MSADPLQQPHTPQAYQAPNPTPPPSTPEPAKNKRARPTISCLECRRKKLKCDRVQPCMQCTKSGRQSLCTFASGAPVKASVSGDAADEELRRKKQKVDGPTGICAYSNGDWANTSRPVSGNVWQPPAVVEAPREKIAGAKTSLGRIFVKGDRSKYLSLGDRIMMLDYFEDAKTFIMTGFKEPDMSEMMNEMSAIQKTFQTRKLFQATQTPPTCPSLGRPGIITSMLNSFPSDTYCAVGKVMYETCWENLTRVLNQNSLDRSCFDLWSVRKDGIFYLPTSVKESVVPQLLATMALSARLANPSIPEEDRVSEEQIAKSAHLVQRWVNDLKGKERLNIQGLKVQVLLLLVHQNNMATPTDLWHKSGNVVRNAMIMGLHRDPEDCTEFSPFEKEQRRKLWRSIVELDIQFSLASGMPTAIRTSDFNCRDLLNLDDGDLTEDMSHYPVERPQHEWTDSVVQIALGQSIKDRLDAANMLGGSIDLEQDAAAILVRAGALERYLHLLPTPIRSDTVYGRSNDKPSGRLFAKIMLDVFIRRPSLELYRTVALSPLSNRYPEARRAAVQSSIAMLSHLDALDPTVADLNTIRDRNLLNLFHVLCKDDILRAAIMLCVEIRRFSLGSSLSDGNGQILREELPWTKHSLTRIVENTLNSLIQRLGEFGSDLKDILPLSIVLQYVRSDGTQEEKRELMRNGAERILKACRKVVPDTQKAAPPPSAPQTDCEQNTDVLSASAQAPVPFYWAAGSNTNDVAPFDVSGKAHSIGDKTLIGADIDFQNFDFGLEEWEWDLGCPIAMSMSNEPN